jgi:hypothetical protein
MARNLLAEANSEINDAARDLRDLAHGIYPPLLAESGLPRSEAPRCRGRRSRRRRALTPDKGHQRHAKYQPATSGVLFIDRSAALTGDLHRMGGVAADARHQPRASRG